MCASRGGRRPFLFLLTAILSPLAPWAIPPRLSLPGTARGMVIQPHGSFDIDYYSVTSSSPAAPDAEKIAVVMFYDIFGQQGK